MKNIIHNLGLDLEDKRREFDGVTKRIEEFTNEIKKFEKKLPIIEAQIASLGRAIELLKAGEIPK